MATPQIYEQIKIGDVTFFGRMDGSAGELEGAGTGAGAGGAFQFFNNVLIPMMLMSKMIGFDFKGLMKDSLGDMAFEDKLRRRNNNH